MKTVVLAALLFTSTLTAGTAAAQPAPFNEIGVTMGHWHIISKDVEANKKIFLGMGGKLFMPGGAPLMMFPGVYINLNLGTEKGEGGTQGSVVNHVGFIVDNVPERVAQWKAAGVPVLPGNNNRLDQAFVETPDGVRIEILEDRTQSMPIRHEHVHFFLLEDEIPKAQAWYAKTFGGKAGTRNNAPVVDVPGGQLRFAKADTKQAPTRGRVLDHIGFDVKDHPAFVKKIEAEGSSSKAGSQESHNGQHHHIHHRCLGYPHRDHRPGALGGVGAIAVTLGGRGVRVSAPHMARGIKTRPAVPPALDIWEGVKMKQTKMSHSKLVSRRAMLATTVAMAATPALAEGCQVGPPQHHKGPLVFLDYDQLELDASYDQVYYEPLIRKVSDRLASNSESMRSRIGTPQRAAYGPTEIEKLDVYRTNRANAPIFIFIHGGNWLLGFAKQYGYPAEMFVNAGAHYVALDFVSVKEVGGDLSVMAAQVRRGIAWVYNNAASFGGDPDRIYIGGHSSGGHLCGVALVTDWQKEFGLPPNIVKGGLCMSGMYEMAPVRLSFRRTYVNFTDAMADTMSSQRHIDKLNAPIIVTFGTFETPDFQRQSRDFAAAVKTAGKPVQLIEAPNYHHLEMAESLGNPYGPNGRAALALMKLAPT